MSKIPLVHDEELNAYVFNCPQCDLKVQVLSSEMACCIFRHAYFKQNFQQINPHMPKAECDRLQEQGLIYGCGKPFQIFKDPEGFYAKECDYI